MELFCAILKGSLEDVAECIRRGNPIDSVDVKNKNNTPLLYAMERQELSIAKFLLKKGADVNAANDDGNTALHIVVKRWKTNVEEAVDIILKYHPKIDVLNNKRKSPLSLSSEQNWSEIVQLLNDYEISKKQVLIASGSKRKLSNSQKSAAASSKRLKENDAVLSEENDVILEAEDSIFEQRGISSDGSKLAQHGNIYQLLLLMLVLWRAHEQNYARFRLATELPEAEKVDDVVFQYKRKVDDLWSSRLVQVKHKEGVSEDKLTKIKENDLLSVDDGEAFSLQKYFRSFVRIARKSEENSVYSVFPEAKIEDLIIITNTDFDSKCVANEFEIEDNFGLDSDPLLKVNKGIENNPHIYKINFNRDSNFLKKVKLIFNETSDFTLLIEEISDHVMADKQVEKTGLLREYFYPLNNEIFQVIRDKSQSYARFNDKFSDIQSLSSDSQSFKMTLIKEIAFRTHCPKSVKIANDFGKIDFTSNESELEKLAGKLATMSENGEELTVSEFKNDRIALALHVINVATKKFRNKFINPEKNSLIIKKLRDIFKEKLAKCRNAKKISNEDLKEVKFVVSEDFGEMNLPDDGDKLRTLAKSLANVVKNGVDLDSSFSEFQAVLQKEIVDVKSKQFQEMFVKLADNDNKKLSHSGKKFRKIFIDEMIDEILIKKTLNQLKDKKLKISAGVSKAFFPIAEPELKNVPTFAKQISNLIAANKTDKTIKIDENSVLNDELNDFKNNLKMLFGHVLVEIANKTLFSSQFVLSEQLPGNLNKFRDELKIILKSDFQLLKQYELKFDLNNWKFHTCKDRELQKKLPTLPTDEDVRNFFQKLKFIVRYPNRKELTNMMNSEIESCFAEIDSKDFSALYQLSMHNWMAERIGVTYTPVSAKKLFNNLKNDLLIREIEGVNKCYFASKNLNLTFMENNEEIEAFLIRKRSQILYIRSDSLTISCMRAIQTLKNLTKTNNRVIKRYTWKLGILYVSLNQLSNKNFASEVLKCFRDKNRSNLLVIECDNFSIDHSILHEHLSHVIKSESEKKLVLIALKNDKFARMFSNFEDKLLRVEDVSYGLQHFIQSSQDELLRAKITFQGNVLSFGELLGDQIGREIISAHILSKLIEGEAVIIGERVKSLGEISNYYCKRFFCPTEIDGEIKYDDKFSDRLAIDFSANEFNELCLKYPNDNVHRLKLFTRAYFKYIWLESRGPIKNLMKYRNTVSNLNYSHPKPSKDDEGKYSEESFMGKTARQKVVIISDIAGMGKSTLITQLALKMKELEPSMWVIRIDLNDHAELFEELKQRRKRNPSYVVVSDVEETIQFICEKLLGLRSDFEKRLFGKCLETDNRMVILFDGFDEICPSYGFIVTKMIEILSETKVYKIWITTRAHLRDDLESKFEVFAYSLDSFSEEDKIRFLTRYWFFKNPDLKNRDRVEIFAARLIFKIASSISDREMRFTGVPLQLKMLAEIFERKQERLPKIIRDSFEGVEQGVVEFHEDSSKDEPTFPQKLNLFSLYTFFIFKKHTEIHAREKVKAVTVPAKKLVKKSFPQFLKRHQKLSLHAIFTKKDCDKLLPKLRQIDFENLVKNSEEEGFIDHVVNQRPFFIHLTFAEYFAADFFTSTLKNRHANVDVYNFLLAEILTKSNYSVIRAFVNSQLTATQLQTSTLTELGDCISKLWATKSLLNHENKSLLFVNCEETNDQIIDVLLTSVKEHNKLLDALLNAKDSHSRTPLHHVLITNNFQLTKMLIQHGDDVNKVSYDGQSTFFNAINMCVQPEIIDYLIESGADVHFTDPNRDSTLSIAVQCGNLRVVEMLLDKNVDVNGKNLQGLSIIHHAVHAHCLESLEVVKKIVSKGCDVGARDETGNTALHYAACKGSLETCKWLGLSKDEGGGGASLKVKAYDESTLMHEAAISGNLDLCKWLAEQGLSILDKDESQRAPLHEAAKYGNLEVVQWLISQGADRNAIDEDGNSVIFEVCKYGTSKLCEWLNPRLQISEKNRMLHVAVRYGNFEVVEWLVKSGADVSDVEQSEDGGVPVLLEVARDAYGEEKKYKLVKYAKEYYERRSYPSDGIERVSRYIAANDDERIIKFLIRNGADVNSTDKENSSVLHWVAQYSSRKMLFWLIKNGINVSIRNVNRKTAFDVAVENGREDLAKSLDINYIESFWSKGEKRFRENLATLANRKIKQK